MKTFFFCFFTSRDPFWQRGGSGDWCGGDGLERTSRIESYPVRWWLMTDLFVRQIDLWPSGNALAKDSTVNESDCVFEVVVSAAGTIDGPVVGLCSVSCPWS